MGLSSTCPYCRREATWCSVQTLALGWPKTRLAMSSGFRMAAADTCLQDRMKIGFEETCHEENISLPLGLHRGDPRSTALKWIFLIGPYHIHHHLCPILRKTKVYMFGFLYYFPFYISATHRKPTPPERSMLSESKSIVFCSNRGPGVSQLPGKAS